MQEKLEQIKDALRHTIELADKVTTGPWISVEWASTHGPGEGYNVVNKWGEMPVYNRSGACSKLEAAFIAHARTFAPAAAKALLVAIEALERTPIVGNQAIASEALRTICLDWPEGNQN